MNLEFTLSVANPSSRAFQGRDVGLGSGRYSPEAIAQMHTEVGQYELVNPVPQGKPSAPEDYWQIVLQMKVSSAFPWTSNFVAKPNRIQWLENYSWRHSGAAGAADEVTARAVIVKEPPLTVGGIADSHSGDPAGSYPRYVWRKPGLRSLALASDAFYRFRLERVSSASASLQLADIGTGTFKVGVAA